MEKIDIIVALLGLYNSSVYKIVQMKRKIEENGGVAHTIVLPMPELKLFGIDVRFSKEVDEPYIQSAPRAE